VGERMTGQRHTDIDVECRHWSDRTEAIGRLLEKGGQGDGGFPNSPSQGKADDGPINRKSKRRAGVLCGFIHKIELASAGRSRLVVVGKRTLGRVGRRGQAAGIVVAFVDRTDEEVAGEGDE